MNFVIRIIISTLAVLVTTYVLHEGVSVDSFFTAVVVAVVLGILNVSLKPLLIVFAFPAVVITFGLFLIVINTLMILLASHLIGGFHVKNFWWALLFSVVNWAVTSILNAIKKRDEQTN